MGWIILKGRGYQKKVIKQDITYQNYLNTLYDNEYNEVSFNALKSYKHPIYSIECNKVGLSNYCNKRYFESNEVSYPHGRYKIQKTSSISCLE